MNNLLLPPVFQKEIRREKIMRAMLACIVLFAIALLIGIVFLLPSYFALVFSRTDVLRRLDVQQKTLARQDISALEARISDINQRALDYKTNDTLHHSLAPLLASFSQTGSSEITLNSLLLEPQKDGTYSFKVQGIATTRDAFLAYVRRLKDVSAFSAVHSPVSNLLNETKVRFRLDIDMYKENYFYAQKP